MVDFRRNIYIVKDKLKRLKDKIKGNVFSDGVIFRNDDVAYDSDVINFKELCELFHKYGFVQLHAITLYGLTKSVAGNYYIGDNQELIDYINSIPDPVALHGLYHSDYSLMTYEEQENDIGEGLRLMHQLFPGKTIDTFVAPFNHTNKFTYQVCKNYGLQVSKIEGISLEHIVSTKPEPLRAGKIYRYHHHRFFHKTTLNSQDLSITKLAAYFSKYSYTLSKTNRVLPSVGLLKACVNQYNASWWYIYAYKEFMNRAHAYLAYKWITKNVSHRAEILEVACGGGGMLYHLHADGFENLSGYDYKDYAIDVCKAMAEIISAPINCYLDNAYSPQNIELKDVIVWVNGMYHLDNYTLDMFFEKHMPMTKKNAYFIFDMVDISFNKVKNNEYLMQDWSKLDNKEKRPSEYKIRMSDEEVIEVAKKYDCMPKQKYAIKDYVPRNVYVFQRSD